MNARVVILGALLCASCRGPAPDLTLWHSYNGKEKSALEAVIREQRLDVEIVQVPYDALADKISNAIPNGNGPDLFVFAHDRLGDWALTGILEPISFFVDEAMAKRFAFGALSAMATGDELYGLPLAVKAPALYYRTDLVDAAPRTAKELIASCSTHRRQDRYALAYENTDLYFHAGFLHAHDGGIFDDAGNLRISDAAGGAALEFARSLRTAACVPPEVDASLATTLFNEGKAAMVLSGPWFAGDIQDGVPWNVAPLPTIRGATARPFLSAEGVWMSSRARNKSAAFRVMHALAGDASAELRQRIAGQIVPRRGLLQSDQRMATFQSEMEHAVPTPSTSTMRVVWQPYRRALSRTLLENVAPGVALADAERDVQSYLRRGAE